MAEDNACNGIRHVSCEDIIAINRACLSFTPSEQFGILKPNELSSAQQSVSLYQYFQQCEDIFTLAAQLFIKLNKAHAFNNGNKRTAFVASVIFLRINGFIFQPDPETVVEVACFVATNKPDYDNPEMLSSWFKAYAREADDDFSKDVQQSYEEASGQLRLIRWDSQN